VRFLPKNYITDCIKAYKMSKRNRPKWHVIARYGNKKIEFYARTGDEVMSILLAWIRRISDKKDWPFVLKLIEGIKE